VSEIRKGKKGRRRRSEKGKGKEVQALTTVIIDPSHGFMTSS
jgi:hypothetical protein